MSTNNETMIKTIKPAEQIDKLNKLEDKGFYKLSVVNTDKEPDIITGEITLSKSGAPCLFESGGAFKNKGYAFLVATPNGNRKKAIHIFNHGYLACKNHAVIPVRTGDLLVRAYTKDRKHVDVRVYKIRIIDTINLTYEAEQIDYNEEYLEVVFQAAKKSCDYHCRTPYFIREDF